MGSHTHSVVTIVDQAGYRVLAAIVYVIPKNNSLSFTHISPGVSPPGADGFQQVF